jgi:hypothetical protein
LPKSLLITLLKPQLVLDAAESADTDQKENECGLIQGELSPRKPTCAPPAANPFRRKKNNEKVRDDEIPRKDGASAAAEPVESNAGAGMNPFGRKGSRDDADKEQDEIASRLPKQANATSGGDDSIDAAVERIGEPETAQNEVCKYICFSSQLVFIHVLMSSSSIYSFFFVDAADGEHGRAASLRRSRFDHPGGSGGKRRRKYGERFIG